MSLNLNKIIIAGRICADLELKQTASGLSVVSFTIATDRKTAAGKDRVTDFIPCTAWRSTAEFLAKYFTKGSAVCVCGTLQSRKYTDKDGNNRTAYEVVVDDVSFVESKADKEKADAPAETYEPVKNEDDLPF